MVDQGTNREGEGGGVLIVGERTSSGLKQAHIVV